MPGKSATLKIDTSISYEDAKTLVGTETIVNVEFERLFTPGAYTNVKVNFDTGERGSAVATQTLTKYDKAQKPADDPTCAGFDFVNWYTDDTYTTLFDFENTRITEDTTVYANWSEQAPVDIYYSA